MVCQISGQDNVSYEIRKLYWHFFDQKGLFMLFLSEQKVTAEISVLTRILSVTAILTIALHC